MRPPKSSPVPDRIIIGVDPGSVVTGYGLLHFGAGGLKVLGHGVIRLGSAAEATQPLKLAQVFERILALLDEHKPDEMAIEAPFHHKNVQSMLKLGRVQGVVMAAAMSRDIPVAEYAPLRVKKAVTGRGSATKEQVAAMLPHHLPDLRQGPAFELPDASDALAIALCHHFQTRTRTGGARTSGSWSAFVAQNPGRVK